MRSAFLISKRFMGKLTAIMSQNRPTAPPSINFAQHLFSFWRSLFLGLGILVGSQSACSQSRDTATSFYTLVPFDADEHSFFLSVVSDSSMWYTTNKGVFHYDGTRAIKVLDGSLFAGAVVEVLLIDALADDDIWVLGHDSKTWTKTVYHFDGRDWKRTPFPQVTDDPADDLVVFNWKMIRSGSKTIGYAVGQEGLVYFYDGKEWTILHPFCGQNLRALSVLSDHDVWVGGRNGTIYHFDGTAWRQAAIPDSSQNNYLFTLSFTDAHDGWAGGKTGMLHFDGTRWEAAEAPVPGRFQSFAMRSSTDGWAVTANAGLLRYDGKSWRLYRPFSGMGGANVVALTGRGKESKIIILCSTGLVASHEGRVPSFTDISASSNMHLYGGTFTIADFDGNGTPDASSAASGSFRDRLYSNRGDGFFNETTERLHRISESSGMTEAVADIDNNGLPDIFMIKQSNEQQWYANLGGWKFAPRPSPVPPEQSVERSVPQFADMDNDGDLDLVYLCARQEEGTRPLTVFYNNGVGNFTGSVELGLTTSANSITMSFFLADLNNDGRMDIFKYNPSSRCELFLNNGDRTFRECATESGIDGTSFEETPNITWAYPVDINRDGALDVFIIWRKGKGTFFLNDGHGRFHHGESITFDPLGENPAGAFADIDSDGDQDLFLLDHFYRNDNGRFTLYREATLPNRGSVVFSDIDGDGDQDVLFLSFTERSRIFVYRNDLDPRNVVALRLQGIRSNSFAIGARVTLWKYVGKYPGKYPAAGAARILADYREVEEPLPIFFSIDTTSAYSIDVDFPGGIHRSLDGVTPGKLTLVEFSFPLAAWWDFVYSFRRSILYADVFIESIKALGILAFLSLLIRLSVRWKNRRYLTHPLFLLIIAIMYVLSGHATIREGMFLSSVISVSGVVLLGGGWLLVSRSIVQRREARYIVHYKLLQPIGEGGMGKVYRAQDVHTKKIIALKVLNTALLQDPENRRRLTAEGQMLSSFHHPHIVKVFEIGESAERGFIAMEYLAGGTLKQRLDRSFPLPLDEVKRLALQICDGLEEIHRHGIIHRDMKSGNIMLDDAGSIRIMDFGLSKSPLVTTMTTMGTVLGTLGYVAPEQVTNLNVDHRVDIFSMGVILYELLTNKLPFIGENEIAVIHAIFNTLPPEPATLNASLPAPLNVAVMKCLEKNPDHRFPSVTELKIALDADYW